MWPIPVVNILVLSASVVLSAALLIASLGSRPLGVLGLTFALFAASEALWAAATLVMDIRLALGLEGAQRAGEWAMLFLTLMAPLLLLFASRYVENQGGATLVAAAVGVAGVGAMCIPLFRHQVVTVAGLRPWGSVAVVASPLAMAAAAVVFAYLIWSFLLFLLRPRESREPIMPLGVLALSGGLVDALLRPPFPVMIYTNCASLVLIGYGVVRRQIFSPLARTAADLEVRVSQRTAELEEAQRTLEARVEERTLELQERARRLELLASGTRDDFHPGSRPAPPPHRGAGPRRVWWSKVSIWSCAPRPDRSSATTRAPYGCCWARRGSRVWSPRRDSP